MATAKSRAKVCFLDFVTLPFPRLGNLAIEFADRLTSIAGHKGIGKSPTRGLVANIFGAPKGGPKSHFGESGRLAEAMSFSNLPCRK